MNQNKREFRDFLLDMANSTIQAQKFVSGMQFEDFESDTKTVYAVMKAIEIIGEASKKVPDDIKQKYSQIPWKEIAGIRDKIVHDYFGTNPFILFDVLKNHLPELEKNLRVILKEYNLEGDIQS